MEKTEYGERQMGGAPLGVQSQGRPAQAGLYVSGVPAASEDLEGLIADAFQHPLGSVSIETSPRAAPTSYVAASRARSRRGFRGVKSRVEQSIERFR